MICEKCNREYEIKFGSGRFCSRKCANSKGPKTEQQKEHLRKKMLGRIVSEETKLKVREAVSTKEFKIKCKNSWLKKHMAIPFDNLSYNGKRKRISIEQNHTCLHCKLNKWLDLPIVLELDHIDGNNKNNQRDNLRMICPNCHAQTVTWRGKNNAFSFRHKTILGI